MVGLDQLKMGVVTASAPLIATPEDRAASDEMIARSEFSHFQETILHAIDHLWGAQRMPDDTSGNHNHELLTRPICRMAECDHTPNVTETRGLRPRIGL
jgi:hypothetical protein